MFDKNLFTQHIVNTPISTLQEQGSPIMASERDKFALVSRAATMTAAKSPLGAKASRDTAMATAVNRPFDKFTSRADRELAAARAQMTGVPESPYVTTRRNLSTGEYEKIIDDHHSLHFPRKTSK